MTDTIITSNPQNDSTANVLEGVKDENLQIPTPDKQKPCLQVQDDDKYTLGDAAKNGDLEGVKRLMEKAPGIPWEYGSALSWSAEKVNGRFGRGAIFSAACGKRFSWRDQKKSMSPAYTTCWGELPKVFAI